MEAKKIDLKDPVNIDNAVKLSKSDFINLYDELGYNKILSGVAWHQIRTSPKGQEALSNLPKGNNSQAHSHISDFKEEGELLKQQLEGKQPKVEVKEEAAKQEKSKPVEKKRSKKVNDQVDQTLVGKTVQFSKKGHEEVLTGKVISVFMGTDKKVYTKIRLADYTTCMKQVDAVKVIE